MTSEAKVNNVYLLGAGFDRAVFDEKAPLNNKLLDKLKKFAKNKIVSDKFNEYLTKYRTENIEEFLTCLDIQILRENGKDKDEIKLFREKFNSLIAEYFAQFRFNESIVKEKSWLGRFVTHILAQNNVIVDLNYTTFTAALLDYYEVWSPNGGYSEFIGNTAIKCRDKIHKNEDIKNILLHKIHGCENFRLCNYLKSSETYIGVEINSKFCPKTSQRYGAYDEGLHAKPYVIAPSYIKIPHEQIERLIIDTIEKMDIAKNLIIIGCGLRPEDSVLWLMLSSFFKKVYTRSMEKKITIVDPEANFIGERIEKHFGSMIWDFFTPDNFIKISKKLNDESIDELKMILKSE
ncbi:MAG: hypothetical protein CVU78_04530 [Elusimicrobia bacterium HGW-Elusimicrobia-2]|nr:MAG: hypothetical protein CVU78_04530 [Elusimicrobia bacterium HGW-Elusimicrobia-2]